MFEGSWGKKKIPDFFKISKKNLELTYLSQVNTSATAAPLPISTVKTGSSQRAGPDHQTVFYAGFYGLVWSGSRAGPEPPLSHCQSQSVSSLGSLCLSFFFNFDFFFRNPQQTTAAANDPHLSPPLFTNNRHLPQLRSALLVHCAALQQHRRHTPHPLTAPLHANSLATTSQTR
ncbi:hypothetical protein M9H77_36217 [Catharanthus roseus]|uniref:Uncharacterized protein n=1 Tax=Catharanthus roseus TaxID=4058 RepID=A0ACB9ZR71_CATRO|nr:hypothetical protein M9H77_36217 [Catharanthus roseus]